MGVRKGARRAIGETAVRRKAPLGERRHVLFYGDNLDILRDSRRIKDESVDLCYMDPPFNSKRNYNQIYRNIGGEDRAQAQAFIDTWEWDDHARTAHKQILANEDGRYQPKLIAVLRGLHSVLGEGSLFAYLVGMSARIAEIQRVLKATGSFYLHCDPTSSHYLKLICDAAFCSQGGDFQNEIIWKRTNAHSSAHRYGPSHDVLLFYSKSDPMKWNNVPNPLSARYAKKFSKIDEKTGRNFQDVTLTGSGVRRGESGKPWRGFDPTPKARHWAIPEYVNEQLRALAGDDFSSASLSERLDKLDAYGLIYWPKKEGGQPRYKWFMDDTDGVALQDVWTDIDPVNSQATERLGYPTQKPLALLRRIILSSSNEGDVVLDPCCGCGTTIAAAEELGRRWIGIDITYQSISLVLQRLEDQVGPEKWAELDININLTGIPRDMESAVALANKSDDRVRKEFEKWAVLTYTNNRAVINEKKGADAGIDGRVYFVTGPDENAVMVLQVKSGGVGRGDIAKLHSDMIREKAAMATLITLEEPTSAMASEAKGVGLYHHDLMDRDYDKIRIVTVKQIIEGGARLELPLVKDLAKVAPQLKKVGENLSLFEQTAGRKSPKSASKSDVPEEVDDLEESKPHGR